MRFGTGEPQTPGLDELIALDAEVRAWAETIEPVGASRSTHA